ncbi:hypothetical protein GA0061093_12650 [Rhodococcus qingshengii]|nr:hypothetical protein GA0061093_12650 [Rhodococcus qingshengii]
MSRFPYLSVITVCRFPGQTVSRSYTLGVAANLRALHAMRACIACSAR